MILSILPETRIEVWISAILTIAVFSVLYKDNPLYKFVEHLFVGVSAAYWMVIGFWSTLWPNVIIPLYPNAATTIGAPVPSENNLMVLIPLCLGLLMFLKLVPRLSWIGNIAMAFIFGTTAGYGIVRYLRSDFINQIGSTIKSIIPQSCATGIQWDINGFVILFCTTAALYYFMRVKTEKPASNFYSRFGLFVLMTAFGVSFGSAVMGRITLLVDRLYFLFSDFLGII